MPDEALANRQRRKDVAWRAKATSVLLGLGVGLRINSFSDDVGYRGAAAAFTLGAVGAMTSWLRSLPRQATLPRYTTWLLLVFAVLAIVFAVMPGFRSVSTYATLVAAALLAAAVLIPSDRRVVLRLLGGAASISVGVPHILDGVTAARAVFVFGVGSLLLGLACLGLGICLIFEWHSWLVVMILNVGCGIACMGIPFAFVMDYMASSSFTILGIAVMSYGITLIADGGFLRGNTIVLAASAIIGLGVDDLTRYAVGDGIVKICGGIAALGYGIALQVGLTRVRGVMLVLGGSAAITSGAINIMDDLIPYGTAVISGGLAAVVAGAALVADAGGREAANRWIAQLTGRSTSQPESSPNGADAS